MKKAAGYLLISLHALIVVFFLFHERLAFAPWLQSFGRVHPLLLHLPIGVLVITAVLVFFRKSGEQSDLITFLLAFTAVTSALTALMGLVLGAEGGYDDESLSAHRIAGVLMSFMAWATYFVYTTVRVKPLANNLLLCASIVMLLITGHLGSVMTHGDQFVLAPLFKGSQENTAPLSDSTSLFRAAVFPVLEEKCMSCHNNRKMKGGLSFASGASTLKGGENGQPWHPGEPNKSLLITRILLPEGHEEHMPPEGQSQLSISEVNLLYQWVQSGADTTMAWTAYDQLDTVRRLAERMIQGQDKSQPQVYHFDEAPAETIEELNDSYRAISRVAMTEPALSASMFIREQYTSDRLKDLRKIDEQLVELNLSGMSVTDEDCEVISEFVNLEKLNLNFSNITSKCLESLADLERLRSLAVAGTAINDDALLQLREFDALKEVFIWNTGVKDPGKLASSLAGVAVQTGAFVDEKEVLRLSPPHLVNETMILADADSVRISHKLPGTILRFTIDGTEPDTTTSPVLKQPLAVSGCTELKVVACKPGWYCSRPARFLFFKKGLTPATVTLNTPPDKDYKGQGSITISDNKKGFADNTRGDIAWLGYRENSFDALFTFDEPSVVNEIVISYARNIPAFLFPPASAEIWAGNDKAKLNLIRKITQPVPTEAGRTMMEAFRIPLERTQFSHYRIIIRPVPQLPAWHSANTKETKDKRGWVFLDEIFFN